MIATGQRHQIELFTVVELKIAKFDLLIKGLGDKLRNRNLER